MTEIIDQVFNLFRRFGGEGYGEALSLEQHMLQTAALAQSAGAADDLIVAALLHDIGYFIAADQGAWNSTTDGPDLGADHEAIGAAWLTPAFGVAVTEPIALHVEAKRYLCRVDPNYRSSLSSASRQSLSRQGGAMDPEEASKFMSHPAFRAAVQLRRWDDSGKSKDLATPSLGAFRDILVSVSRRHA